MANKRQKPAEQLKGKGSQFRGVATRVLTPIKGEGRTVPPPPEGLRPEALAAWDALWHSPIAQSIDLNADGIALRRWICAVSERLDLHDSLAVGIVMETRMGERLDPRFGQLKELTREIAHYEEAFGLTPLARMRLGIAISAGASSIEDLKARLAERASAPRSDEGVINLEDLA